MRLRFPIVVLLWVVAGCNQVLGIESAVLDANVGSGSRKSCVLNSHCPSSEVCIFRVCSQRCELDRDCDKGQACLRTPKLKACIDPKSNQCNGAKDCPEGTQCVDGKCLCAADAGGACSTNLLPEPPDAGERMEAGTTAPMESQVVTASDASVPTDAAKKPSVCDPMSKRCEKGMLQTCRNDGQWDDGTRCAYVCTDGACGGSCVPGDHQCTDTVLKRCDELGQWQDEMTCPKVCTPGGCVDRCDAGAKQCSGLDLLVCTNAGMFAKDRTCDYVCSAGACIGECVPDDSTCADDHSTKTCDAHGHWQPGASCDFVCTGNACAGECKPATAVCIDARQRKLCGTDGMWAPPQPCSAQACVTDACVGACSPGTYHCQTGSKITRETCDNNGQWGSPTDCTNICDPQTGDCGGSCRPSRTQCASSTTVQTCGDNGQWPQATDCPFICDTQTNACGGQCAPGTHHCYNADPISRVEDCVAGTWTPSTSCSVPTQICSGSACVANNPYPVGNSTKLSDSDAESTGTLLGFQINLTSKVDVLKFGMWGRGPGAFVKLALYRDNGGVPGGLVGYSVLGAVQSGAVELDPAASLTVAAGTYWLMATFDSNAQTWWKTSGGPDAWYMSHVFSDNLPNTFDTTNGTKFSGYTYNYYVTVRARP